MMIWTLKDIVFASFVGLWIFAVIIVVVIQIFYEIKNRIFTKDKHSNS